MYEHGIFTSESATAITAPTQVDGAVQVVFGTAPINLAKTPGDAVNKPIIAFSLEEAVEQLGYSSDFKSYTLCQCMDLSFNIHGIAPIVFVNVLDPKKHKKNTKDVPVQFVNSVAIIYEEGIMLDESFKIADSLLGIDYLTSFNNDGHVIITAISDEFKSKTDIKVEYTQLDPTAVITADVLGGVDVSTLAVTGISLADKIYQTLNIIPAQLLAPGYSHIPEVGLALQAKAATLSNNFKCIALLDADNSEKYTKIGEWKNNNSYTSEFSTVCYLKPIIGDKVYYGSALLGAINAAVDAENSGIPYVSASNHKAKITGTVMDDGSEVTLDIEQANLLNSQGIVTFINMGGWRIWGSETAAYPNNTDVKDRFIPVRRIFNWIENTFIETYFQKVDNPTNIRLIESVVDSFNIFINGLVGQGALLSGSIVFNESDNPLTSLLDGKIKFRTRITPTIPAKSIENIFEVDVNGYAQLFN